MIYLEGEFGVVHPHPVPEPHEGGVDEVEESDESDEVDGDIGHQFDGLGRAVGRGLDDVALRPANKAVIRIVHTSFLSFNAQSVTVSSFVVFCVHRNHKAY